MGIFIPVAERFWSKIKIGRPDECWEYMEGRKSSGYGQFYRNGHNESANRIAWELTYGKIPEGMWVLHNCPNGDNRLCCNPAHLWLGTHQDNMNDMRKKNRSAKGSHHSQSKLNEAEVIEIRKKYLSGKYSQKELAVIYGVRQDNISRITSHKYWKHI